MKALSTFKHIFLCRKFVDMRKQIQGLSILVEAEMELSIFQSALFVFCNKRKTHLKILYWDKTGFALWLKILDKDRFKWPTHIEGDNIDLNHKELRWLLKGFDLSKMKPHKKLKYNKIC